MAALEEIIKDNADSTEQLKKLVGRLSDEELRTPMPAGWTISTVLAHLAFWDQRAIILIEKWKREGVSPSPMDMDVVNDVTREVFRAIEPRRAAELVVAVAEEVDKVIAGLTPEMVEAIETKGTTVRLKRAIHRRMHIEEIEKVLGEG